MHGLVYRNENRDCPIHKGHIDHIKSELIWANERSARKEHKSQKRNGHGCGQYVQ
jgi:hypothetical protein